MDKEAVGMERRAVVTEEMMAAGARSLIDGQENRPGSSWADEALWCYEAMHALAQQPAAQAVGLTNEQFIAAHGERLAAMLGIKEWWDIADRDARIRATLLSRAAPTWEAKPVAWRYRERKDDRWRFTRHSPETFARPMPFVEPLYAAPQPSAQKAEQPAEEARGVDAVGLDGLLCEHCGEGHTVLTFESGQFACNCDTCSADCQDFAVERLNALFAAPAAAEVQPDDDQRAAVEYFQKNPSMAVLAFDRRRAWTRPAAHSRQAQGGALSDATQEYTLRAMALNYTDGHSWDKLDTEVCAAAADEIGTLRAILARAASEPRAEGLDDELNTLRAVAAEYDACIRHMDAGGDFHEFQRVAIAAQKKGA